SLWRPEREYRLEQPEQTTCYLRREKVDLQPTPELARRARMLPRMQRGFQIRVRSHRKQPPRRPPDHHQATCQGPSQVAKRTPAPARKTPAHPLLLAAF